MFFLRTFHVVLAERAVLLRHGLPVRALAPGRHRVFGRGWTDLRFKTDALVFGAPPEIRSVFPQEWFAEVEIGARERAVLYRDGRPMLFLRPGVHRYWTVDASVALRRFSVDAAMPDLSAELRAVLPSKEWVETLVDAHDKALHYASGRLVGVLEPGRHAFWSTPDQPVDLRTVDLRRVQVAIVGQELMTRDKVTLRLSLTVEYAVSDPVLATHAVASVKDSIYLAAQLAARQFVAGTTLDELLEGKDAMARFLEADVGPKGLRFGVTVERVGVKDVVLPGEMKTLRNRVIEAEKESAANVIRRREETAATRSLANTARVMAEQPVLLRLKELEALEAIAARIGKVQVVVGADGLKTLLPSGLLGPNGDKGS